MLLKISCEYCGEENIRKTDVETMFYCPTCDDEIDVHECDIEIVKEC